MLTVIEELKQQGAQVIVPSMAFGVDNGRPEELVYIEAEKKRDADHHGLRHHEIIRVDPENENSGD
ncbi:hypothetical protein ACFTAO_14795 [Paenibacillus rhizoplanae]